MESINSVIDTLNGVLFSDYTVYALLVTGLIFTVWSFFGQYRALTHGVAVVRGKYDDSDDPGAINHFQALSAALSATVGLGNIAGVAVAVALGGPGAVLWMWLIGLLGMALKMTEVTQSMLFRNTDDPDNPHGGPMFVVQKGLAESASLRLPAALLFFLVSAALGYVGYEVTQSIIAPIVGVGFGLIFLALGVVSGKALGTFIGGVFVITLIISAITGGNMFQAWSVADITKAYADIPQVATGLVLAVVVGLVIIGGIKRIGAVAGRVVPFMCVIYVAAALYVLVLNAGEIPAMLALIVKSGLPTWLGGESPDATGAFLGGTFVYAAMWGVKRALFSSEAGQGSSPIAHSAAKTDEPVREGVVAGLEPFIDTIVVCTLTALVILSSGAFNREAEAEFKTQTPSIEFVSDVAGTMAASPAFVLQDGAFTSDPVAVPNRTPKASETESEDAGTAPAWEEGETVFAYAVAEPGTRQIVASGVIEEIDGSLRLVFNPIEPGEGDDAITSVSLEQTIYHGSLPAWKPDVTALPRMTSDARTIRRTKEDQAGWRPDENIFMVVEADLDSNTGRDLRKFTGTTVKTTVEEEGQPDVVTWSVEWNTLESEIKPFFRPLVDEDGNPVTNDAGATLPDTGLYADYAGATLTAYAFDRVTPGLGMWLVSIAAWLFAVSTMISWSYYGEQGIYFLFRGLGDAGTKSVVFVYKLIYCALILLTCVLAMPIIRQDDGTLTAVIGNATQLDMWTTLGLGVMLVANVPIMLIFGAKAMGAYRDYFDRMERGEDGPHDAPKITDVVEGKDVE